MNSLVDLVAGLAEGSSISNIFFGISVAQACVYARHWDRDPTWMKVLAIVIMLLETGGTVFAQRGQYFYTLLPITDPLLVLRIDWCIPAVLSLYIILEIIVQQFYLYRMWVFSRNLLLTLGTNIVLCCRYGLYISCIVDVLKHETWLELKTDPSFRPSFICTCVTAMFSDTIIASTMAFYLHRRQSQFQRTRNIITWLTVYFVNTGAILVAITLTGLITYLASPNTLLFGAMAILYTRALANVFFGMLNARTIIRTKQNQIITLSGTSIITPTYKTPQKLQIHVVRDTEIRDDIEAQTELST